MEERVIHEFPLKFLNKVNHSPSVCTQKKNMSASDSQLFYSVFSFLPPPRYKCCLLFLLPPSFPAKISNWTPKLKKLQKPVPVHCPKTFSPFPSSPLPFTSKPVSWMHSIFNIIDGRERYLFYTQIENINEAETYLGELP
mmetsp:Transcript_35048/g.39759  ORF Transcript_35048/g.39759 Transcript_35048/m.39759 type:complete len:140 (+) Transcript_35048:921-1340(+)